jgi:outer membrane protein assembly factor BamB
MRAALALAGTRDRDAVPVLIDSITELPGDQSAVAEEYLSRLAGDAAPQGNSGSAAEARKKRGEAWAKWWKDNGDKVRLVSLTETPQVERLLGYTLVVSPNQSRIAEVDKSGKTRWEITNLSNPWDAQVLSKNRLLVLEQGTRRITERTLRGDILWEQAFPNNIWPVGCQRLSNGNTLLISSNRLVEVRRDGKEAFAFDRPHGDIMQARKLKDGTVIFVTSSSSVHRIDATGKEVKTWRITHPTNQGIHILPNGNVVFPQQYNNRVYEYNPDGQQVWTATAINPVAVHRLPNGNTLISSYSPYQLTEVDRSGKEIWKVNTQVQGLRVSRR